MSVWGVGRFSRIGWKLRKFKKSNSLVQMKNRWPHPAAERGMGDSAGDPGTERCVPVVTAGVPCVFRRRPTPFFECGAGCLRGGHCAKVLEGSLVRVAACMMRCGAGSSRLVGRNRARITPPGSRNPKSSGLSALAEPRRNPIVGRYPERRDRHRNAR